MLTLSQVVAEHTSLGPDELAWLKALTNEWSVLADCAFSDLILWVPQDENVFWAAAQIRPVTGPTALEDDVVGNQISYEPDHLVTEAFLSEVICETSDNQLSSGIPVDVWAIPVIRNGRCIAVVERHTNQMGVRAPSTLEDNYREIADILADMMWRGEYPTAGELSTRNSSPRVGDGVVRIENDGTVAYASPNAVSAFRRLGITGDLIGDNAINILEQLNHVSREPVDTAVTTQLRGHEAVEVDLENDRATVRLRMIPLTDANGPRGRLMLCRDTTELRHRERQLVTKDATIREIHHRVKNNLQTVAALLRMQARRISSPDAAAALRDAMSRVQAIAVVHEILSQSFDEAVNFDDIADRILRIVGEVAASQGQVTAVRRGKFGQFPAEAATSLSLVVTELCQNAIEHGLASKSGNVTVIPTRAHDYVLVEVLDDGKGLPEGFTSSNHNLGLSIVQTLVEDMGGTFELGPNPSGAGARAAVRIPIRPHKP